MNFVFQNQDQDVKFGLNLVYLLEWIGSFLYLFNVVSPYPHQNYLPLRRTNAWPFPKWRFMLNKCDLCLKPLKTLYKFNKHFLKMWCESIEIEDEQFKLLVFNEVEVSYIVLKLDATKYLLEVAFSYKNLKTLKCSFF